MRNEILQDPCGTLGDIDISPVNPVVLILQRFPE